MERSRKSIALIFLTIFIDMVGFGIVIPVLPLYAQRFGASPFTIGCLVGIYSAMQLLFSPLLGRLSDRYGRRPVLIMSLIGTSIGFLIMGLATAVWVLFLARIIDGITGGNISTAQSYIADVTPPEKRSSAMGLIGAAFGLGFICGPMIGGLMSQISLAAPFYFAAALAALDVVLMYFFLPETLAREHRLQPHDKAPLVEVFRHGKNFGSILACYFFSIAGFAIMTTLYALFTNHRFGYDARSNGYIFAYVGFIGVLVQGVLLARLIRVFGEQKLMMLGAALLAASMFALPLSGGLLALLMATTGIALGNSLLTPTLHGLASRNVDGSWQGRALGVMQSAGSAGRLVGPLLAGWLLTHDLHAPLSTYGRTPFWISSAILLVALGLTVLLAVESEDTERVPEV